MSCRDYFIGYPSNNNAWVFRIVLALPIFWILTADNPPNSKSASKSHGHSHYLSEPLVDCPAYYFKHIKEYSHWHAATLTSLKVIAETTPKSLHGSLQLPVAIVVYRCGLTDDCGGLGDRLCGITAMFYHYGLRLRSLFLIDMPAWKGSVRPATFNWEFPGLFEENNSWLAAYTNNAAILQVANMLNGNCLNLPKGFPCIYTLNSSNYNNFRSKETIKPGVYFAISNRGVWSTPEARGDGSWMMHQQHISQFGLDPANWGCIYRSILWPTESIADEIASDITPILEADVSLCVHHRSGDNNMRSQGFDGVSGSFFSCTRDALQFLNGSEASQNQALGVKFKFWDGRLSGENVHVFLSADSASTKEAGTALLGMAGVIVSSTTITPQHSNWKEVDGSYHHNMSPEEAMRSSLRDWFTLGACPAFSSSMYSGFVRTASAFSRSETFYAPIPNGDKCQGFRDISLWLGMGSGL
jgi:hypothetical protein